MYSIYWHMRHRRNIYSQAWGAGGMMDKTKKSPDADHCRSRAMAARGSSCIFHLLCRCLTFSKIKLFFFLITKRRARFLWLQGSSPFHQPFRFRKCLKCIQAQEDNSRARGMQKGRRPGRASAAPAAGRGLHCTEEAPWPCPNLHVCIIAEKKVQAGKSGAPLGCGRRHEKPRKTGKWVKLLPAENSLSKCEFWKVKTEKGVRRGRPGKYCPKYLRK